MKELLQARIFSGFPSWKSIAYQKEVTPKVLQFEIQDGEILRPLYLASVISRDEKTAWQSFQNVLDHTATIAQNGMRGFFGFDILTVDIQEGLRNFDPKALGQLLINHARTLGPGQKTLIRYGQLFGLLHYRAPAEWGKVEMKTHVDFFTPKPASGEATEESVRNALLGKGTKQKKLSEDPVGSLVKKLLKEGGGDPKAIYFIHNLSTTSLWDPKTSGGSFQKASTTENLLPEIYLCHGCQRIPVMA
jgi:hypothetical protein